VKGGTLAGILAAVVVLFTCAAVYFTVSGPLPPANTALVDADATKDVTDQVSRAIRTVFSYDPTQLDHTATEAQKLLTGQAITQYNAIFAQAKAHAVTTQQVLTTAVRSAGVIEMHADTAKLLVFVDRQIVAGDQHQSAAGQLVVTAAKSGSAWQITEIQILQARGP
jgi:Mce-associated membrane protein